MENEKRKHNEIIINKTIENFKKRKFEALFFENKEMATSFFFNNIKKENTIGYGGSRTLSQLQIIERLRKEGYNLLDRNNEANTPEIRAKIERDNFFADVFIASCNAVSMEGQLVNLDLYANRVCATAFGPKDVYLFIGYNKITSDLNSAIYRTKNIAAPMNAIRFNKNTPCTKTGKCADCFSEERICATMTIIDWCIPEGRIKLLFINEELGF
ncbi:MAG: lactate utilization protein [Exilispira sp.]